MHTHYTHTHTHTPKTVKIFHELLIITLDKLNIPKLKFKLYPTDPELEILALSCMIPYHLHL
jgi:hypothetical protein